MLKNEQIEEQLQKAKTIEDYEKLYITVFAEPVPITSYNWGNFPSEDVIDAILERKPIKKDKLLEKNVDF
tara:strand:+ start:1854 stop:2063 length:210 start_codon:yes stop_codon:yes gene_type:complete